MNTLLERGALLAGFAALAFVGAGYLHGHPLALAMIAVITAFFVMGALELRRFNLGTGGLQRALGALPAHDVDLPAWLATVPDGLREAVRQRVAGERAGLPGPALTPYLAGLLVLLGMLGTFLGMVATLGGTGVALESAVDLATMRETLAAPVKGLGLAFGTSVAGVAASAMLGLASALARRERAQVNHQLDAAIAGPLRGFGRSAQREAALTLLQRQADQQAELLPRLVAQLETLSARLDERHAATAAQLVEQSQTLAQRLTAQADSSAAQQRQAQERFHQEAGSAYRTLAESVDGTLQRSLSASAQQATAAIAATFEATVTPVVERTLGAIAAHTGTLQTQVTGAVEQQLAGIAQRFDAATGQVAQTWQVALDRHAQTSSALSTQLEAALSAFSQRFDERAGALTGAVAQSHAELHERLAGSVAAQLDGVSARLGETVDAVGRTLEASLARQSAAGEALAAQAQQSLAATSSQFEQQAQALLATLAQSQQALQSALAERDEQRLAAWHGALDTLATGLQREWQAAGQQSQAQQQQICQTLEDTAGRMSAQAEAHARGTITEIAQLVQTASEAPRAAAELVGQLREQLSGSLARDNAMLEERNRMMATLNGLLEAVQKASGEQKTAIDALVAAAATNLDDARQRLEQSLSAQSERLARTLDAQGEQLADAAAQVGGSAVEVASLGEAFQAAVALFGQTSERLVGQLQTVEATLAQAIARSDDQLAYYVAQAREVIDLSIMSQKQVVEDLQRIAVRQGAVEGAEAAA